MELGDLIGHNLCSAVATHTLLLNRNVLTAKLSNALRYSIVICIASILLFLEIPNAKESLYAKLGLPINATHYEIVGLHSKFKVHISKHGAPDNFAEIKRAFEILSNEESRSLYNRFGDMELDMASSATFPIVATALAFSYQILSSILCFTLNWSNQLKITRYIIALYNAMVFALEIESRFVQQSTIFDGVFYLNKLLPFQRVKLLRSIPPALTLIANLLAVIYCVDSDRLNLFLWQTAVTTNRVIVERMADVVNATNYVKSLSSPSTSFLKASSSCESPKTKATEKKSCEVYSTVSDLLASMDDGQKQKLVDLLKCQDATSLQKMKQKSWVDSVKSPIVYIVAFIVLRYLIK